MWLAKLKRMMDEVPNKYLEPKRMEGSRPEWVKLVGQLTADEARLLGVASQLEAKLQLEDDAHKALHGGGSHSMNEACLKYHTNQLLMEREIGAVVDVLFRSISERLSLPESEFAFDGYDIYAFTNLDVQEMRKRYELVQSLTGPEPDDLSDLLGAFGHKKMN